MKKSIIIILLFFILPYNHAQTLYSEKFNDCDIKSICIECGDTKAKPQPSFTNDVRKKLTPSNFIKTKGFMAVQVLVKDNGEPCVISIKNNTNLPTDSLDIVNAINNSPNWNPAISKNKAIASMVSLFFEFNNGKLTYNQNLNTEQKADPKSNRIKKPTVIVVLDKKELSNAWTFYTKINSNLPWNSCLAVRKDLDNHIWVGTGNGVVEINGKDWKKYSSGNSILAPSIYGDNRTTTIRYIEIDNNNTKWFIAGWDVYKLDGENWSRYDSTNSPISWPNKIIVDQANNIWFTTAKGVLKLKDNTWTTYNKDNSNLPSNKTTGLFIDRSNRIWVGTQYGNVIIENGETKLINDKKSPLSKSAISKVFEDKNGNLWFSLLNPKNQKDEGIYVCDLGDNWRKIDIPYADILLEGSTAINDFFLDEDRNELWIAINGKGLMMYNITENRWEVYHSANSAISNNKPEQIIKDKDGIIWVATQTGLAKQIKRRDE